MSPLRPMWKADVLLRVALIATLSLALCHAGRAQTPSVTISVSPSSPISAAYFVVQITTTGFSSVSSVSILVIDNAGHQFPQQVTSGSNPNFQTDFDTTQLIPSGATSYNAQITVQAFVNGTGTTGEPPPTVSASSNIPSPTVQIGYILSGSNNTAKVTVPPSGGTVKLVAGQPVSFQSDHHWEFTRYDSFGLYSPSLLMEYQTTFPSQNLSQYQVAGSLNTSFPLPQVTGSCDKDYNVDGSVSYGGSLTNGMSLPFYDEALSFYPTSTQIASDTEPATAVYP